MRNTIILIAVSCISIFSFAQKTEVIVIGNIHQPVPNYNSDTIVSILNRIQPDFLLHELDSSFFTPEFTFKEEATENEGIASVKYIAEHPNTKMRPFDFEGRNEYRKINGFNPTEGLAVKLLDSLYKENRLTKEQHLVYKKYINLLEPLKLAASKNAKSFNNSKNDKICEERQYYQYHMLLSVMKEREEFSKTFYTKPDGEKIAYGKGFELAAKFWDVRNHAMAGNILKIVNENPGKKIVVLTGFMHRYYLIREIKKHTSNNQNIQLKEFYEF